MALVVCGALFPCGFGEQECSPVRDAADYAAGGEDLSAGCAGNPVERGLVEGRLGFGEVVDVLFNFVHAAARADLSIISMPSLVTRVGSSYDAYQLIEHTCIVESSASDGDGSSCT